MAEEKVEVISPPLSIFDDEKITIVDTATQGISNWLYLVYTQESDLDSNYYLRIRQSAENFVVFKGTFTCAFNIKNHDMDIVIPFGNCTESITQVDMLAFILAGLYEKTFDSHNITSLKCYEKDAILHCKIANGYFGVNSLPFNTNEDTYTVNNCTLYFWPVYNENNSKTLLQWYVLDYSPTAHQILTQVPDMHL